MGTNSDYYDPWFISIVTLFLTLIIQPSIYLGVKKIRSLFGAFSGTYISVTQFKESNKVLIEAVILSNVSSSISGKLLSLGVSEIEYGAINSIDSSSGKYSFDGFLDERVIVVSYKTKNPREKSAGNLTLRADPSGNIFWGVWSSFEEQEVKSGPCHWFKTKLSYKELLNNKALLISEIKKFIPHIIVTSHRQELMEMLETTFLGTRDMMCHFSYHSRTHHLGGVSYNWFENRNDEELKQLWHRLENMQSETIRQAKQLVNKRKAAMIEDNSNDEKPENTPNKSVKNRTC